VVVTYYLQDNVQDTPGFQKRSNLKTNPVDANVFGSRYQTDPKDYLEYTVGGSECPFFFFLQHELIFTSFETQTRPIFVILAVNISRHAQAKINQDGGCEPTQLL